MVKGRSRAFADGGGDDVNNEIFIARLKPLQNYPKYKFVFIAYHIMSLSLFFSSSPPNMRFIAPRANLQMSLLSILKCCVMRSYSLERLEPNTPTSSVCY